MLGARWAAINSISISRGALSADSYKPPTSDCLPVHPAAGSLLLPPCRPDISQHDHGRELDHFVPIVPLMSNLERWAVGARG